MVKQDKTKLQPIVDDESSEEELSQDIDNDDNVDDDDDLDSDLQIAAQDINE